MKKLIISFCVGLSFIFSAGAFEVNDLRNYKSLAVKTFTQSDSLHKTTSTKTEIAGTKELVNILGQEKIYYTTEFVYLGKDIQENSGETTWYYITPKSWKGKRKYSLYYRKNDVMQAAYAGDTLVIARKDDDEILLLIAQKGSDFEQQIYDALGLQLKEDEYKVSFWNKLFGKNDKKSKTEQEMENPATVSDKKWMEIYFTPGLECENNIIAEINQAKKIDIAVYSITNQNIVDAIIAAKKRGAKVRVITDRLQSAGKYSLAEELESAGIPVITNVKHKIMHNKFAIFDGKRIESGSYNWTDSATKSNAENCMFFDQEDKAFTKQFNYLWDLYSK